MSICVVDTSVVVASVNPGEPHHDAARAFLREAIHIVSPTILLAEVAAAIARGADDEARALQVVEVYAQGDVVELVPVDTELGELAADVARTCRIRGCDAVFVALARSLGCPLVTLDRQQLERSRGAIEARLP